MLSHTLASMPPIHRELIALAEQNARHLLEELKLSSMEAEERAGDPVYELGRELGLQRLPRSLVCFDISTTQGTDTVGSCVWFENGRPKFVERRIGFGMLCRQKGLDCLFLNPEPFLA